jgi:hypothetical protein
MRIHPTFVGGYESEEPGREEEEQVRDRGKSKKDEKVGEFIALSFAAVTSGLISVQNQ